MQTAGTTKHIGADRAKRGGRQVVAGNGKASDKTVTVQTAQPADFKLIPRSLIDPSKTNPRKDFGDLTGLAASIEQQNIIEPLIVRPKGKRFEIVAGERRYRAATMLETLPCIVRELSDADAIEIQGIENIQRQNLKPLEEAAQYRLLIDTKPDKFSAEIIGKKQGKSASWVWDVMKILDLIPEAKKLLDEGRISINHAIPIARLTPAQQKQVIDPEDGGLFRHERHRLQFDDEDEREPGKYDEVAPVSVKELQAYIAEHIRFNPKHAAQAAPLLFDNVAQQVKDAEATPGRGKKVIPITHSYHLQDSAKDPNERTYSTVSWRRADGSKEAPACSNSVLGVVVAGEDYGQAFHVCIARDKCEVHWPQQVAAKKKREREKAREASPTSTGKANSALSAKQSEATKKREAELELENKADDLATKLVSEAAAAKLTKLPKTLPKELVQLTAEMVDDQIYSEHFAKEHKAKRITQANFLSVLTVSLAKSDLDDLDITYEHDFGMRWAVALGVDVKKLRAQALAQVKLQMSGEGKKTPAKSKK